MNPIQRLTLAAVAILASLPCHGAMSIYLSPEDLAGRSPLAVEATVTSSASALDPATGTIATYVELAVERVLRGPAGLERVVLREPGGSFEGLVHQLDAVPTYAVDERVLVFLEPAPDGALRTAGMFFGKFDLLERARGVEEAVRDLEGQGTILRRPADRTESFSLAELRSIALRQGALASPWSAEPPETARLIWDSDPISTSPGPLDPAGSGAKKSLGRGSEPPLPAARFTPISSQAPARWQESDSGQSIPVNIQRSGDPLGDPAGAVAQILRAAAAWTEVPESRVSFHPGDTDYDYTGSWAQSPASTYTGVNIVLFDDPYGDISDPVNCGGVLAIGGYWRSGAITSTINNVSFHPALQLYVVFNDNFQCFLGDPDNLAEVATHELGHSLGFGHSTQADAIMRSSAYGNRGPRLGEDDRDAAHCHYPHTLALTAPAPGAVWAAGESRPIQWTSTAEAGPLPGSVDLEYSTDGGSTWSAIAGGTENDGHHAWLVPDEPTTDARIRIRRPHRGGGVQPVYPEACTQVLGAGFSIEGAPEVAGAVPDGSAGGAALRLEALGGGTVRVSWGASCSPSADEYAIYEGGLDLLRSGVWDHHAVSCGAGVDLVQELTPGGGDRYFLVAPLAGSVEGGLGSASDGGSRPEAASACGVRQPSPGCSP